MSVAELSYSPRLFRSLSQLSRKGGVGPKASNKTIFRTQFIFKINTGRFKSLSSTFLPFQPPFSQNDSTLLFPLNKKETEKDSFVSITKP